jgi:hypothetical protein
MKSKIHPLYHDFCDVDNVVGLGQGNKWVRGEDTQQDAILVFVKKKFPKNELSRNAMIPAVIDGVQTDIIEVGEMRLHADRKTVLRPARPGVSIGHFKVSAGTFGSIVYDRHSEEAFILSNNHVLANLTDGTDGRCSLGDTILQPGAFDNPDGSDHVIGTLKRFIPVHRELNSAQCRIALLFEDLINKIIRTFKPQYRVQVLRNNDKINLVDCAVALPANPADIDPDILEIGKVAGIKEAALGMAVKKSGRSSGVTHSLILATNVSMKINISKRDSALFADQILAGPMSMPGDSGSLILTEDNFAVGLLFAGSEQATLFNRIDHVLDSLEVVF